MVFNIYNPDGSKAFSIESTGTDCIETNELSLESLHESIESSYTDCVKCIDAVEVMSAEGFGEKISKALDTVKRKLIEAFKRLVEFFRNMGTNFVVKNMKNQSEGYKTKIKSIFTQLHTLCNKNITYLGSGKLTEEGATKCKNDLDIVNFTRNKMLEVIRIINLVAKDADVNSERIRTISNFKKTMDSLSFHFDWFFDEAKAIADKIASYKTVTFDEYDDPPDNVDFEEMKKRLNYRFEETKKKFDEYKSLIGTND